MTPSPLTEAILKEAEESAERINAEAEEEASRIEQEAETRGRREGEKRAREVLSEAESRAERSKVRTRSVEEGESREAMGRVRAGILEDLFGKLSGRFIDEVKRDKKTYRELMQATVVDAISRLPSSTYHLEVPKGHPSLYRGEEGILQAVDRRDVVTLRGSQELKTGFVLRAEDTGATVSFDLEGYLQNLREDVLRELDHAVFQ